MVVESDSQLSDFSVVLDLGGIDEEWRISNKSAANWQRQRQRRCDGRG